MENENQNYQCEFCEDVGSVEYWKKYNENTMISMNNCFCVCNIGLKMQATAKEIFGKTRKNFFEVFGQYPNMKKKQWDIWSNSYELEYLNSKCCSCNNIFTTVDEKIKSKVCSICKFPICESCLKIIPKKKNKIYCNDYCYSYERNLATSTLGKIDNNYLEAILNLNRKVNYENKN